MKVALRINGRPVECQTPVELSLRELLHDHLGYKEVRYGCGEGVCGACMVLLDGEPVASCLKLAVQAEGADVVTAAGLEAAGDDAEAAQVRLLKEHLLARGAFQCGYCACGMLVSAAHALKSGGAATPEAVRHSLSGNLCRCSGYQQIVDGVTAAAAGDVPPAVRFVNENLRQKIDATVRYPTDAPVEDPLVGRILWSEHPAARITALDVRAARALPGVEAVLTSRDIPGRNRAGTNVFISHHPLLAVDRVRSMGDAVALVAAQTEEAARAALEAIKVRYEVLPAVLDPREAARREAPRVHRRSNLIGQFTETRGDVEAGLRQADLVVEDTYFCTVNDHACMELEGGLGWYEDGVLVLSVSCETPYMAQRAAALALDLPTEQVRILAGRMGGAFGKYLITSIEAHLALLVHKTGKPVKLVLDRKEALARAPKRHPFIGTYRLGLRNDGTLLALEADVLADSGPYVSMTPAVISIFAVEAAGAYEIPHLRANTRGVLTNNLPTAPMRGFGTQQISFGIESIIEKAARTLGMDPLELRRKNLVRTRHDGRGRERAVEPTWLDCTAERALEALGPPPEAPAGWLVGRGVTTVHAKYGFPYGFVDRFLGRVTVNGTGAFEVASEVPDAGTGVPFGLASLLAERFGLEQLPGYRQSQDALDDPTGFLFSRGHRPGRLRTWCHYTIETLQSNVAGTLQARMADLRPSSHRRAMRLTAWAVNLFNKLSSGLKTWLFPYGPDAYVPRIAGSRSFYMAGRAVLDAADHLEAHALALAAQALGVDAGALEAGGRGVYRRDDPEVGLSWAELAAAAGGTLTAIGTARLPRGNLLVSRSGNQVGPVDFMDGTHACDLAVDPDTGEVRILGYAACHDVGRAFNPETIRGQVYGGIAMGIGQALYEHLVVEQGQVKTQGLHEYLVPTSLDVPGNVSIILLESGEGLGPGGAKGVGEGAAVAAPNVVANALYDALGVQLHTIPATPEAIAEAARRR